VCIYGEEGKGVGGNVGALASRASMLPRSSAEKASEISTILYGLRYLSVADRGVLVEANRYDRMNLHHKAS